ncbi:hypothetical protein GGR55DRAFT_662388 [Xylaria sp. FL0064]|nr:hypothetical protein GGR55DRAFT_662388 [Xylaria sp. FL0064]
MPLLRLPPETLAQIFDYVGSSFFHEDLARLTVSKRWLEFALPTCFKRIALSPETLRSLATSGGMKSRSPLERNLEILDLELRGYNNPCAPSNESLANVSAETWKDVLDDDLTQLSILARQSRKLRTLRIRACSAPSPEALDSSEVYLSLSTIQGFLSVANLSVLVLDLPAYFPNSSMKGLHICPAVGALLPTLHTLHVRMHTICPDVLRPGISGSNLHLSIVAVSLSLITNQPGITSAAHSKRCGSLAGGLLQLKADLQEQAEALVSRMVAPKTIRLLTHSLPLFEIQSLDVLTGKTMVLNDDADWDEDGKTIIMEDSEPESDIPDDEFSDFSEE